MIFLAAALLVALALLGLTLPWWSPRFMRPRGLARREANAALYRERLAQLPNEMGGGTVSAQAAEELKGELAARLLEDAAEATSQEPVARSSRWVPIAVTAALVLFAAGWYLAAGSWRTQALVDLARIDPEAARVIGVDRMIGELEEHLKAEPGDAESWIWLARSYRGRERYALAAEALEKASTLKAQQDPDVLTEWGEVIAFTQERTLTGRPAEKFQQALALAPDHPRALWYAGAAAMQAGDERGAIEHWERLLQQDLPHELRAPLEVKLAELRQHAGLPAVAAAKSAPAAGGSAIVLHVNVKLAPEFRSRIGADDTVFVYAVDPAGPPMPLAVKRLPASVLPELSVDLTDADSPMPTRKLSSVDRWHVVARVSKSGNAMPQSGDLEGSVEVTGKQTGEPVVVSIDRQRP